MNAGAKLANIFSTRFTIETADAKQEFSQTWKNNMAVAGEPQISKRKGEQYTRVTFVPDFPRFGMSGLDEDIIALIWKRCYDIAGSVGK